MMKGVWENNMKIKFFQNVKTYDELKKAYRDLMKKYHPDLNSRHEKECTEICKEINAEFEYLFKVLPNKRINKENEYYEAENLTATDQQNIQQWFDECEIIIDISNMKAYKTLEI